MLFFYILVSVNKQSSTEYLKNQDRISFIKLVVKILWMSLFYSAIWENIYAMKLLRIVRNKLITIN